MLTPRGFGTRDPAETEEFPSPVERLAQLLVLDAEGLKTHYLMAIQTYKPWNIYLDETTQNRRGPPAVWGVGAYVSTFDDAIALHGEWAGVLQRWGIKVLHTTDFVARQGEFQNSWTDDERKKFIVRLAEVAVSHMTVGYSCIVREDEYNAMGLPPTWEQHFRHPHGFCLFTILGMLVHNEVVRRQGYGRLSLPSALELLFDDNPAFHGIAYGIFNARQAACGDGKILKGLSFRRDEEFVALQAADLLTYMTARERYEEIHGASNWFPAVLDVLRSRGNKLAISTPTPQRLSEFVAIAEKLSPQPVA